MRAIEYRGRAHTEVLPDPGTSRGDDALAARLGLLEGANVGDADGADINPTVAAYESVNLYGMIDTGLT